MRRTELAERVQRTFPIAARLVRIDRVGGKYLAGRIDHRDLAAGADAGVETPARRAGRPARRAAGRAGCRRRRRSRPSRRPSRKVANSSRSRLRLSLTFQAHATHLRISASPGRFEWRQPRCIAMRPSARLGWPGRRRSFVEHQLRIQPFEAAAAEHGERAVRGHGADRLGVIEVVRGTSRLPGRRRSCRRPVCSGRGPRPTARGAAWPATRRLRPSVRRAGRAQPVEHRGRIGKARVGIDEGRRLCGRVERRIGEELVGERLQARFARDHRLRAALGLVRQVEVFELLLRRRRLERALQLSGQLALLGDALDDRGAALFELAQVGQARVQLAQLHVVEVVGRFLAVAGDERHGGAAVEQLDCGLDLRRTNLEFGGNLGKDVQRRNPSAAAAAKAAQFATRPEAARARRGCSNPLLSSVGAVYTGAPPVAPVTRSQQSDGYPQSVDCPRVFVVDPANRGAPWHAACTRVHPRERGANARNPSTLDNKEETSHAGNQHAPMAGRNGTVRVGRCPSRPRRARRIDRCRTGRASPPRR